jgi:hypothetical protein
MKPNLTEAPVKMDLAGLPTPVIQQIFSISEGEASRAPLVHERLDRKSQTILLMGVVLQILPMVAILHTPRTIPVLVLALVAFNLSTVSSFFALRSLRVQTQAALEGQTVFSEAVLTNIQASKVSHPLQALADYQRFITLQFWEIIQQTRQDQVLKARLYSWSFGILLLTIPVYGLLVLAVVLTFT